MKIVFLIGDLRKGGAERVIANLGNTFCNENDVTILMTSEKKVEYEVDKKINLLSLDGKIKLSDNQIINNIKRISQMKKIILQENPDVIVSFLKEPTGRILILKSLNRKIKKIPLIVSIRNNPINIFSSKVDKILLKTVYNLADGYVFQTEDAKKYFNKKIQKKSVVIPNPINPSFICDSYIGERKKTIVTVGRLTKQKNQKLLIDAFSEISLKYEDYKLLIYGEGELESDIKKYIAEKKLNKKVLLMGTTTNIKQAIYDVGMFILSSDYEGMPNALMEAMALGIPCISTNCPCGGPKYLIQDKENGLLIPVGDKAKLIEAMEMLIKQKDFAIQIGKNASKIKEKLSPDKINNKWEKFIKKVGNKECK